MEVLDVEIEEKSFVEEADDLLAIVRQVVDSNGTSADSVYDRYRAILYKYQEQSQLLDAYLEGIVMPLAGLLRKHALAVSGSSAQDRTAFLAVCRLLNVLVIVRGYKTVVKFFPHEASDLETVLNVLAVVKDHPTQTQEESLASWEAQTILVLWLSILILIPFELATVDTAAALNTSSEGAMMPYTLLVARVMGLCKEYLSHPGSVRDMASLLLGRLLTRPDQGPALQEFLEWCDGALATTDDLRAPFLVPGVLQALCFIFKLGQRSRLLPHTPRVWAQLSRVREAAAGQEAQAAGGVGGVLARKLSVKLGQRLGLTFMEPRLAPWRYVRADAGTDLDVRLGGGEIGEPAAAQATAVTPAEEEEEELEYELVEEVEEVIEMLLGALRDKDTVVRWSGAKGVGRVTGCLPKELGDEVVGSVMELFRPTERDTAWHGGCLALAELARRGLLLPDRLPSLEPIIRSALVYDVRRGAHSIGAHVRDAAAYVCWASARAYAPEELEAHVAGLAASLLTTACYDREVNCRRAAAAAFQEAVGRLGNFPHGIAIMAVADYFSVGNINQAYTKVAPAVAAFPEYCLPLAKQLVHAQLRHWEKSLRELAARGLAALATSEAGPYLATEGLDTLLPLCLDPVLEVRHGAVVGVAELLPALKEAGVPVEQERKDKVCGLVPAIDKARLYRGKGGEVMREAVSKLVAAMASVQLQLNKAQHAKVREALDENLRNPQPNIQKTAVAALRLYTKHYLVTPEHVAGFSPQLDAYLSRLHDANVAVRRGYAQAVGTLPAWVLKPQAGQVVSSLIEGTTIEDDPDERDVEGRMWCVRSLSEVCGTLYNTPAAGIPPALAPSDMGVPDLDLVVSRVLPCLHTCLTDYSTDNRGDVGSWVREAGMEALVSVVKLLADHGLLDVQLQGVVAAVCAGLLQQSVERIARVRETAIRQLRALLGEPRVVAAMPAAAAVSAALPTDDDQLTGVVSLEAVRRLAGLLAVSPQHYTRALLEGLVASVGGVDAALARAASSALVDAIQAASQVGTAAGGEGQVAAHTPAEVLVAATLLQIWQAHAKSPRMAGPVLRTADLLVTRLPGIMAVPVPAVPKPAPTAHSVSDNKASDTAASTPVAPQQAQPAESTFADVMVELCRAETRQCTDVSRLLDAANLLCHLLPARNPCRTSAYQGLLVLLGSRYPTVRRHTAEQLYLALLALEPSETGGPDSGISEDTAEAAQEAVLEATWDGDMDAVKEARAQLSQLLQVPIPAMKAPTAGAAKKVVRDENASYQALLDDFARGV